jgi:gas vesicle protein
MSRSYAIIVAFLAGAATGAALGILFAPDEGKNTRDKISFLLDKYRNRLKELINDLVDKENQPFSEAKAESQKVISDARTQAEKLLGDVDALMGQIKDSAKN